MEHTSETRCSAEQLFVDHFALIQRVTAAVARQHRLSMDDAEEFAATVHLRLIADDYAVLRKFRGGCSLHTFLRVVIQRFCLDFRDAQWGKWRPSAAARRRGSVAVLLERLTMRDGLTFEEACAVLERTPGETIERDTLARIYRELRVRTGRRVVGDEALCHMPACGGAPDEAIVEAEQSATLSRALAVVSVAMKALTPREQLMLQLRFADGLSVAAVAKLLRVDQKRLYRRYAQLLVRLRRHLETHGVHAEALQAALGGTVTVDVELFGGTRDSSAG